MDFAVSQGRAIVTFNSGDFSRLHAELMSRRAGHYGMILAKQLPVGEMVKRLAKFLFTHPAEGIKNNIYRI